MTAGLTDQERALCRKLGECAGEYVQALGNGEPVDWAELTPAQQGDLREFVGHIHDLQHAVMARAAIRAHPEEFRP